jgi:tetratricopeptide (TPR) repeat protein
MSRRPSILSLTCLLAVLWVYNGKAQTYKIDSLKKKQPLLQGPAAARNLDAIAQEFVFSYIHADSALRYAKAAEDLAARINDRPGKALALITRADVHGRLLGDPGLMAAYSRQAIAALQQAPDPQVLSSAYYTLSLACTRLGQYDEAAAAAERAKKIATAAGDSLGIGKALQAAGFNSGKHGEYWRSFENLVVSNEIGKQLKDSMLQSFALAFIGRAFNHAGDPEKALVYYHQFLKIATPFILIWPHVEDMAYAHFQLKHYDSALYYQQKHRENVDRLIHDSQVRKAFAVYSWGLSSDLQLAMKQYDRLFAELLPALDGQRRHKDQVQLMHSLLNLGKAYVATGNYRRALGYGRELYQTAAVSANKEFLKEGSQLLSGIFQGLRRPDSALFYLQQFTVLKDSLATAKFRERTALYQAASDAENRIRLLKKDNAITEQQLAMNKKAFNQQAQVKNGLIAGIIVLLLFSGLVLRNIVLKRKNDQLKSQQEQLVLKRRALELEMQALRAQMNPHFIFNCLSAIDNLIQTNQSDKATTYLSRFAKLIRGILDSSKNNLVSFQRDFETMKLYLEIEEFRCNNKFRYELNADEILLNSDYKVPPLVIQPFIENAIHHGLLNKTGSSRQLKINAHLQNEDIIYSITDNGIGRKQAMRLRELNRPGQQSYGIEITRERILLHNKNSSSDDLQIHDLEEAGMAAGTEVTVRVNCFS